MSFGFSVGDFIAGANLAYRLIRALSETQGATMEYQEAIQELGCIQQTFLHVGHMRASNLLCQATLNAIACMVHSSKEIMAKFLEKTKKYRRSLSGSGVSSLASDSWRKIGWSLYKKQELVDLKMSLRTRLMAISVLVSTANHQNLFRAPQVAQGIRTNGHAESAESDKSIPKDFTPIETTAADPEIQGFGEGETKTTDGQEVQADNCSMNRIPAESGDDTNDFEEGKSSQEMESELKAAEREALDAMVRFKLMYSVLQEKGKVKALDEELSGEEPIEFKDAAGRKYSFPFHLCLTWEGMQNVIRQVFGHAEGIGPQIQEGHYDLVGPNGDTLLPQLWGSTVQPGWSVAMHAWPSLGVPGKQMGATTEDMRSENPGRTAELAPEAASGQILETALEEPSEETARASGESLEEIQESSSIETSKSTPEGIPNQILEVNPEQPLEKIPKSTTEEEEAEEPAREILTVSGSLQPRSTKMIETPCGETLARESSSESSEADSEHSADNSESGPVAGMAEPIFGNTSQGIIQRPSGEISKPTLSRAPPIKISDISGPDLIRN